MSGGFLMPGGLALRGSAHAIVTGGTANTKGSWVELSASLGYDVAAVALDVMSFNNSGYHDMAVDFGIGAAASEQVVVSNFVVPFTPGFATGYSRVLLPIAIPAGTRVAARSQSSLASVSGEIDAQFFGGDYGVGPVGGVNTAGFTAATTLGTPVTPGNGVYGSYAQITASTAADYKGFFVCVDGLNTDLDYQEIFLDIAVGAAASEQNIAEDMPFQSARLGSTSANGCYQISTSPLIWTPILAGTRISARAKEVNGLVRDFGVVFYGVR